MRITVHNTIDLYSQGRNGVAKTKAVQLYGFSNGYVTLCPVTSRDQIQNCWIELDTKAMDELAVLYLIERGVMDKDFGMSLLEELGNIHEVGNG